MEPLGVESEFTNVEELPTWSQTVPPDYEIVCNDPNILEKCSFKLDDDLNRKIILWLVFRIVEHSNVLFFFYFFLLKKKSELYKFV